MFIIVHAFISSFRYKWVLKVTVKQELKCFHFRNMTQYFWVKQEEKREGFYRKVCGKRLRSGPISTKLKV